MDTKVKTSSGAPRITRWIERQTSISQIKIALILIILFSVLGGQKILAQGVGISETTIVPHATAILELSHTAGTFKGFLAPRLTTAQRTSIAGPATGLLVYDTDTKSFWYFDVTWISVAASPFGTSNQVLGMNAAGTANEYKTLNETANQISIAHAAGNVTFSTPQDIHIGATPTFTGLTLSGLSPNAGVYTNGTSILTSTPPTSGTIGYWDRTGTTLSPVTAGDNITTAGNLDVDGATTLDGTEIDTDDANFNVIGANQVNLNNTLGLQVANATDLNGTLDVAGVTDLAATGLATNVRGELNVAEQATFTENIDANNGIDVLSGNLNVTANTNLTGNLDVDGATTLDQTAIVTDGGTFDVTGTGTTNIGATDNDVSITTASTGDINITAADNLNLTGTTVTVSGTFSPDNLDVDGATTLDGTEIDTDDANFNVIGANQVNLNNTLGLQVANATDLNGTLDVAGVTDLAATGLATNVRGELNVAEQAT
ncbi:MAG: hypothetical protein KOO66_11885, partial [Bacteroidales bacterium]|nr:hypothetical protein [Bacteroidales bacterium]